MKKREVTFVFALVMSILVPTAFAADATVMPMNSVAKASSSVAAITGKISSIDLSSKTPSLKISGIGGNVTIIQIDPTTTSVWKMGKTLPLSELKSGEQVKVRHMNSNGKDLAKSIEVL